MGYRLSVGRLFFLEYFFCAFVGVFFLMSDNIRVCVQENCTNRMAMLKHDGHISCVDCIGHLCDLNNRCSECESWSDDVMNSYVKHRKRLQVDRDRKARVRLKKKEKEGNESISAFDSSSGLSVLPLSNLSLLSSQGEKTSNKEITDAVFGPSSASASPVSLSSKLSGSVKSCTPNISSSQRDQALTLEAVAGRVNKVEESLMSFGATLAGIARDVHSVVKSRSPSALSSRSKSSDRQLLDPSVTSARCVQGTGGGSPTGKADGGGVCPSASNSEPLSFRESKDKNKQPKRSHSFSHGSSARTPRSETRTDHRSSGEKRSVDGSRRHSSSSSRKHSPSSDKLAVPSFDLETAYLQLYEKHVLNKASCVVTGTEIGLSRMSERDSRSPSSVLSHASSSYRKRKSEEKSPLRATTSHRSAKSMKSDRSQRPPSFSDSTVKTVDCSEQSQLLKVTRLEKGAGSVRENVDVPNVSPKHSQPSFSPVSDRELALMRELESKNKLYRDLLDRMEAVESRLLAKLKSERRSGRAKAVSPSSISEPIGRLPQPAESQEEEAAQLSSAGSPLHVEVHRVRNSTSVLAPVSQSDFDVSLSSQSVPFKGPALDSASAYKVADSASASTSKVSDSASVSAQPSDSIPTSDMEANTEKISGYVLSAASPDQVSVKEATLASVEADREASSSAVGSEIGDSEEADPPEDLSQLSAFRRLILRFAHRFPPQVEEPFDGLTEVEREANVQFNRPIKMCLSKHTAWRFQAINKVLEGKRNASNPSSSLPLFLKLSTAKSYMAGHAPSAGFDNDLLGELDNILDEDRRKYVKSTKIPFKLQDIDHLLRSLHRTTEIWSFLNWSLGAIFSSLNSLKDKIPSEESVEVKELLEFVRVMDTSLKHGLGETAYAYTNTVLKKREQILTYASRDVSKKHKEKLMYAPISGKQLFPEDIVTLVSDQVGKVSKHDFYLKAAKAVMQPKKVVVAPSTSKAATAGPSTLKKNFRKPSFRGGLKKARGKGGIKKSYNSSSSSTEQSSKSQH